MSIFKKIFKEDKGIKEIASIMSGEVKDISYAPDPVFAEKFMGDGFVVFPTSGEIVAPVDGKVIMIYETKHAVAFRSDLGVEVLIHIGMDTVKLGGVGFEVLIEEGDKIKKGQSILKVDLEYIKSQGLETATPVVITNLGEGKVEMIKIGKVNAGDNVLSIH